MRKSRWLEWTEWMLFALVLSFVIGVLAMRSEITSAGPENSVAPVYSLAEE
jgi:hypothetical protein